MPVYEYQCKICGRAFEYQQRMSDPDKTVCEACGGELERLISRTAFALKGGGWYKDLYSSSKPEGSGGSGGAASGTAEGGTTAPAKTETAATPAAAPSSSSPSPSSDSGSSSGGGSGGTGGGGTGGSTP